MMVKDYKEAAKKNIKKAQREWRQMTHKQHARSQPQGRSRAKVGSTGRGKYFRVVVRPKEDFVTFRAQDIGRKGHTIRLAGKRESGSWGTHSWLISKHDAHIENERLVADDRATAEVFSKQLPSKPHHVGGDIFQARPKKDVPEHEKPTSSQLRAWHENIHKAQNMRWSKNHAH